MKYIKTILIIIVFVILYESMYGISRQIDRNRIYKMAEKRSKEINKQLIVVGDPYNGYGSQFYNIFMDGYGCGDETVDLTGCPKCPNGVKSDLLAYLKTKESDSGLIFISCVLEYIDNIEETIKEIYRVANSKDNIFIITVNNKSLAAYLYVEKNYSSKNLIKGPPNYDEITYKRL